jgi:hypothetical protein
MQEILNIIHKTIYQFFDACEKDVPVSDKDKLLLEVNKAICNNLKALEQQSCEDCISREGTIKSIENMERFQQDTDDICEMIQNLPSVTPSYNSIKTELISSEDCISRQAVNKLVDELARAISDEKCHIQRGRNYGRIMHDILELPSVEPKRKKGHWIMQNDRSKKLLGWSFCSECNAWIGEPTDYCSNCGADMREVDNE